MIDRAREYRVPGFLLPFAGKRWRDKENRGIIQKKEGNGVKRWCGILVALAMALSGVRAAGAAGWTALEPGVFDSRRPGYGAQFREHSLAERIYQTLDAQLTPDSQEIVVDTAGTIVTDENSEVLAACAAYQYDHPESQYAMVSSARLGDGQVTLVITQTENSAQRKDALERAVEEFKVRFAEEMAEKDLPERYRFLHDYICERTAYDSRSANTVGEAVDPQHTAFGVLVDGVDVLCEGYAETFKILCDAVGLPCMLVIGEGRQGDAFAQPMNVNHMWNVVCLDGAWYSVDVAWDDGEPIRDTYFLDNTYFLEGRSEQDHRPTGDLYYGVKEFGLPELVPGRYEQKNVGFSDVRETDWFHDAVYAAVERGLFSGVSENCFAPEQSMTRAMMITVLAAMEFGSGQVPEGESKFSDLTQDWYRNAVAWAAESGVTAGIAEDRFGPDMVLTREQAAVFLYAYAKWKGFDVSAGENTNILSYNDAFSISEFAIPAIQWACGAGLMDGTPEGDLLPQEPASRAQLAAILNGFCRQYEI